MARTYGTFEKVLLMYEYLDCLSGNSINSNIEK